MEDERVDRLLRALPHETASADFTARVLARLDEVEATQAGTARAFGLPRITLPAAVLAATLVVAASLSLQGGGSLPGPAPRPLPAPATRAPRPVAVARTAGPAWGAARPVPESAPSPRGVEARRAASLLAEFRAEHGRLQHELRQLREARPGTIYLGGDEDMDLVVHLDRVRELPTGQVRPVSDPPQFY